MRQFGLSLPVVQQVPMRTQPWEAAAGPATLERVARAADRLGFAWITCSDHVAVPASYAPAMGATWYEPGTTLAFLAAVTERVRLLSHVLVLPYRHPLTVAKTYATLDRLSGGRVILGAGSGHLKPEFKSLGVDYDHRGPITDEYVRALCVALETEVSSFEGATLRWRDMIVSPRPCQQPRPPVWIGGNGAAAARRAAALEGWIPWQLTPELFRERAAAIRALRAAAGLSDALALVAPLSVPRSGAAAQVLDEVHVWLAAGATAFNAGLASESETDLVERMEWFAGEVIARL